MTDSKYGTKFVESEAVLAAQAGDREELARLMSTLSLNELEALRSAGYTLIDYTTDAMVAIARKAAEGGD